MISKTKLLIIGARGHGKVVADIATKMSKWQSIEFLDDDESIKASMGIEVIGKTADAFAYKEEYDFFVAIGNNAVRKEVQEMLLEEGLNIVNLVHPGAIVGMDVEIGKGTVVMAGVVINSSTTIGKGCIINTCASIDHDNVIQDYVHVSPGVNTAGNVEIGKGTWLGIGCVVSNRVSICGGCILGAGTVVVTNIIESGTYVGVPAKRVD